MHRCLTLSAVTLAMSLPMSALAQEPATPGCPPGAWFCEEPPDSEPLPAPAEAAPVEAAPLPPVTPPVAPPPQAAPYPGSPPPRGRMVYRPMPPPPPGGYYYYAIPAPPSAPPRPVKKVKLPPTRWGLNLRVEGVAMGRGSSYSDEGSGMGGMGFSLRYRPVPMFAVDLGLDVLGGIDYNGFQRTEVPLSVSGILYLNPRSRTQVYLTGGVDWSFAHVESSYDSPLLVQTSEGGWFHDPTYSADYSYFGGHGGVGLEFRLARHFALNVDGQVFVRGRTDDGPLPEFYDPYTQRTSNQSAGGLFRFGATFWW